LEGASGFVSYIAQDFPLGSSDVPVKAGQLIGYQGQWSGQPSRSMWVHLRFAVVRAADDGSFPDVEPENILDPSLYLGIATRTEEGHVGLRPLRCKEQ